MVRDSHTRPVLRLSRVHRRGRRPHRSVATSWAMLFDDPPAMCCTDDHLCAACALDLVDDQDGRS